MRVTVCELPGEPGALERAWERLVEHVSQQSSELVLLPEMPFSPWFATQPVFDPAIWKQALDAHDAWVKRLAELAPALVLGTRPVERSGLRYNEGFVYDPYQGYRPAHLKYYMPEEEGFWEARWYGRGDGAFVPVQAGAARVGFAICTELWAMERARGYGKSGAQILVTPRASGPGSAEKWLAGGRAAAIVSGAYSLSSNHVNATQFDGAGWIIDPDGRILAQTSATQPFITVDIDLSLADRAKHTYPRYALD